MADYDTLVDVGPATPPPSWCLPDAVPDWSSVACERGAAPVCIWGRVVNFGGSSVWVSCEDQVIGGRVLRSAPRILGAVDRDRCTPAQARDLARCLLAAADLIDRAGVVL